MALHINIAEFEPLTSDPVSPPDGCMWYRGDTYELKVQLNGQTEVLSTGGGGNTWQPPVINLGDGATSGVSVFANTGAGAFWDFAGNTNATIVLNVALDNNGISYDGSNLAVVLYWKISAAPSATEYVEWVTDYAFIKNGDNAQTEATQIINQVVVDGETQDLSFSSQLSNMTGDSGATHIQLTILRNALGGGSDTYPGDAELLAIKLLKV